MYVGAILFLLIAPGNLPLETISQNENTVVEQTSQLSYYDHPVSIIPNNIVRPFSEGYMLSLLLLTFAIGFGLSQLPESENKSERNCTILSMPSSVCASIFRRVAP